MSTAVTGLNTRAMVPCYGRPFAEGHSPLHLARHGC